MSALKDYIDFVSDTKLSWIYNMNLTYNKKYI